MHSGVRRLVCATGVLLVTAVLRRRPAGGAGATAAAAASRRFAWPTARPSCWTAGSTSRSGRGRCPPPTSSSRIRRTAAPRPSRPKCASPSTIESLYMGVTAFDSEPEKWLGYQRRRDEGLDSDDRFMWTIDTFLDGRTGYFFEMNPSGLMADSLLGINGDNREWDGIWNARRAAQRDRLDARDRDPVPHAQLQSRTATPGGSTFSAPSAARTKRASGRGGRRNQGLRRMSNAGARHRHPRRDAGARPRHQAVRRLHVGGIAGARQLRDHGRRERGDRSLLQPHPAPAHRVHRQHRLRADRSRSAPGQPDALFAVLSRAPRFLPRRRHLLRFPQRRPARVQLLLRREQRRSGHPLLQPAHRPERERHAPEDRLRHQDHRPGGRAGHRHPARAHGRGRGLYQRGLHRRARQAADSARSRTSARSIPAGIRCSTAARPATPPASTCRCRRPVSEAHRISRRPPGSCTRRGPTCRSGNSAFGATIDYPNDRWDARLDATEIQEHFDPSIGFVRRRISGSTRRRSGFSRGRQNSRYVRQYAFASSAGLHDRSRQRPADPPDRRDADPRELPVAGQLQHQCRQLPRAARHAVRHQPRHHAAAGRRV